MTQRTRYFLLGSSMVIIVGLATGLVAYVRRQSADAVHHGWARGVGLHAGRHGRRGLRQRA